ATMSENHLTLTKAKDGISEKLAVTKDNYQHFLTTYFGLNVTISRLENSEN
ncbi:arylamine N-acetyltransferase, partial [Staphylococcus aureus]|nr:arylamine N-acetyltransferase [Staphylococcus aureus]